jgi:L-2-hydroxyglutarate oxidase LhgO
MHGVPHRRCGKIIVALNDAQTADIEALYTQGLANGVEGLQLLTEHEVRAMEPSVKACAGLYSPESGILNAHALMDVFARRIVESSGELMTGAEVVGLDSTKNLRVVSYQDSDGLDKVTCRAVVNCAGLGAQSIMRMARLRPDAMGLTGYLCKGDYFAVSGSKQRGLTHLVYPVPVKNLHGLGIHTVLSLDGSFKLGPNAYYVDQIDYTVDVSAQMDFFRNASGYLPFLKADDLSPDMSGMRPKLSAPGDAARDFHIAHEASAGAPGFFNLAGIESPGLTSSPAISRYVTRMVADYLR